MPTLRCQNDIILIPHVFILTVACIVEQLPDNAAAAVAVEASLNVPLRLMIDQRRIINELGGIVFEGGILVIFGRHCS